MPFDSCNDVLLKSINIECYMIKNVNTSTVKSAQVIAKIVFNDCVMSARQHQIKESSEN